MQRLHGESQQQVADLRAERTGLTSRIEVLEGLERSHEGLGTGVREVFAFLEQPELGPWRTVLGILADFLTVRREYAPLIDLALGDRAQRFLVRDLAQLHEALQQHPEPFSGRVSFLPLAPVAAGPGRSNRLIELSLPSRVRMPVSPEGMPAHPGIVALAEHVVTCDNPELANLPAQLLGRTLLVGDLATARAIAAYTSGYRFVTMQGELLEPDGTLTIGTHHAETGILSRKSELRELRLQVTALDRRIAELERDLNDLRNRIGLLDGQTDSLQEETDVLAEQAADLRSVSANTASDREGLHEEVALSRSEISGVEREIQDLEQTWQKAQDQAEAAEREVHLIQARLEQADRELRECEEQRQHRQQACTAAKVALAQVEERRAALEARHRQSQADLEQRRQDWLQSDQHLSAARARLEESQRTLLRTSAALAHWYLEKEAAERQLGELTHARDQHRQERQSLAERTQAARERWKTQQEQAHAASWKSTRSAIAGTR